MYDARAVFGRWPAQPQLFLRGLKPTLLDAIGRIDGIDIGADRFNFSGPASLGAPAEAGHEYATFNPSIAPAPRLLTEICSRCAYAVTLRVDPLHQCGPSSPLVNKTMMGKRARPLPHRRGLA